MFRARGVYHRRRRHRYQSSSDDDSSSSSSSASSSSSHFSDDDEEIDVESISSSSSSLSAASASAVDGEDLVQEMTLSSDSEASDDEDYAVRDSRGEVIPGSLEKAIVMVERLDEHELLHVQQHISKLISTKTPKAVQRRLPAPSSPPEKDLTIQSITPSKILSLGLSLVGFSAERQASAREELNIRRFISFYGAPPMALAPLFIDVKVLRKEDCPTCEDLFMTCNWLKCYDTMHVLEGRWGYCEDYMRPRIIQCQKIMQALRKQKMKFVDSDTQITASLDTVSFMVQEFRNDPSSKWFDHKTKSAGLKYETCVCTDEPGRQVWLNGPFPCGEFSDITVFRGGDEKIAVNDRDKSALYFQMPQDKMLVADSAYAGEYDRIVLTMPEMKESEIKWLSRLKARGETLHSRLKSFRVLGSRFRHGKGTKDKMDRHQMATESVSVIVLYDCENGRPLFEQ